MTRTSAITSELPVPTWVGRRTATRGGAGGAASATRRRAPGGSGLAEIVAGGLLLIAWAILWTLFLDGVAGPAARLSRAADRPWLDASAASPTQVSPSSPGAVDTTPGAP